MQLKVFFAVLMLHAARCMSVGNSRVLHAVRNTLLAKQHASQCTILLLLLPFIFIVQPSVPHKPAPSRYLTSINRTRAHCIEQRPLARCKVEEKLTRGKIAMKNRSTTHYRLMRASTCGSSTAHHRPTTRWRLQILRQLLQSTVEQQWRDLQLLHPLQKLSSSATCLQLSTLHHASELRTRAA